MPFTISHAAAAVPLLRTRLVTSALVIGTMTPDVPFFLFLGHGSGLSHSWAGVVSLDLVLGVLGFVLWQRFLRSPVADLSPAPVRRRLRHPETTPAARRGVRGAALVALSVAVGAATHILWDAFTHSSGWGTALLPWLSARHGPWPGYLWAQVGSSVAGLLVLAGWFVAWLRATAPDHAPEPGATDRFRRTAWAAVGLCGVGAGAWAWVGAVRHGLPAVSIDLAFPVLVAAVGATGVAVLVVCAVWRLSRACVLRA